MLIQELHRGIVGNTMSTSATDANSSSPIARKNAALSVDPNLKAYARRRSVAVFEKAPKTAMLDDPAGDCLSNDDVVSYGKDSGRIIRGEPVLERFSHLSQLKKGNLAASFPSKQRQSLSRLEKPIWKTLISSLTKSFLLLATLLYAGQVIRSWSVGRGKYANHHYPSLDFDARILEMQSYFQKITKMLQAQLEVVDHKIGSEVGIVSEEIKKQIEDKSKLLEMELKNLKAKSDYLANTLSQLKSTRFLSKEELDKFLSELKARSSDGTGKDVNFDQIRSLAGEITIKEIEKHAADGLGRVDYALASGGARVVKHSELYLVEKDNSWLGVTKIKNVVHSSAQKLLQPSFGEPGQCFPLQGSIGFVTIRLRAGIVPEAVTLEHVSKSVAYDRSSAPKECRVSGWFEGPKNDPSTGTENMLVLTEFSYDIEKSNAQTFTIQMTDARIINTVRLDFISNHGSSVLTCIYRFRVHGYEPNFPIVIQNKP